MAVLDDMKVLLHLCCAPDGTIPLERLLFEGNFVVCFFYGHNIHPQLEYEKRLQAVKKLVEYFGVQLLAPAYDPHRWFLETKHLAKEPEGGKRCMLCYRLQIEEATKHAIAFDCEVCATSLTVSPHKDPELINAIGKTLSNNVGLSWIDRVWRKRGGFIESVAKSKELALYRQRYCGCVYSIRG